MPTLRPTPPPVPNRLEGAAAFNAKAGPFADWLAADASASNSQAIEVSELADVAVAAAAAAASSGAAGQSTSTTSLTVGTGAKSLTVQTGKSFVPGMSLTLSRTSAASTIRMQGIVLSYVSGTGALSVDVGGAIGAGTFSDWTVTATTTGPAGTTSETYQARSTNVQITAADSGKWIDITGGTFSQSFVSPAALGNAFRCRIRNSGTGDITIPSSDGLTNWIMYPGEVRDFNCDGLTIRSVPIKSFLKTFASPAFFIQPPGYLQLLLDLQAAGGGGARSGAPNPNTNGCRGGAGGSGGGRATVVIPALQAGTSQLVTVGAGGLGGSVPDGLGGAGGNSSFGLWTVYGGRGAVSFTLNNAPGGASLGGFTLGNAPVYGFATSTSAASGEYAGGGGGAGGSAANETQSLGYGSVMGGAGGGGGGGMNASNSTLVFQGQPGGGTLTRGSGEGAAGGAAGTSSSASGSPGIGASTKRVGGGGGGPSYGNGSGISGGRGGNGGIGAGGGGGGASYGTTGNGGNGGDGEVTIGGVL